MLSATFAQLEVLWPGHSWLHPAKLSLCQVSAFSEQGPRPVCPFALLWVKAGQRPHSPLFLRTTWSTISLVKPFAALPYMVASFPGQFNNPQGLAARAAINGGVYMSENVPGYK